MKQIDWNQISKDYGIMIIGIVVVIGGIMTGLDVLHISGGVLIGYDLGRRWTSRQY